MVIKKKTVLVIDDDQDFCDFSRAILEAKGMIVKECFNIKDARIYLETEVPNIILLDMELKNEHGTDFLKERGKNPLWLKIPVIVCSSQKIAQTVKDAIKYGADDYLLKPMKQTWLIQRIRKFLIKENESVLYFKEDEKVDIIVNAKPFSVSEASFISRSSIGFDKGVVVLAIIPQPDGAPVESYFKSEEKSRYSSSGPFDTLFSNVTIAEAEINRVQMLKTFWRF